MTIRALIDSLEELANHFGNEVQVRVVDGEGEYQFSVHAEPDLSAEPPRVVVCIDTTALTDEPPVAPPPAA